MKKITYILLLFSIVSYAQSFTYGINFGGNFKDVKIKNGNFFEGSGLGGGVLLGAFGDYQISEKFGIKSDLSLNIFLEDSYYDTMRNGFNYRLFGRINSQVLQLNTLLKYDVDSNYNKGFYTLLGFNVSSIIGISAQRDDELIDDFMKKSNLAGVLGFGTSIWRKFNVEFSGNIGLSDPINSLSEKGNFYGGQITFSYYLK